MTVAFWHPCFPDSVLSEALGRLSLYYVRPLNSAVLAMVNSLRSVELDSE
jgi:hypothetical protein